MEFAETQDEGESFLLVLDAGGKTVSLTVEHAGEHIYVSKHSSGQVSD